MGTQTRDEFRTRVRFKLDNRADVTDAQIDDWVNDAYDHVSRPNIFRHRELQTTQTIPLLTTVREYALSTDVDYIYTVFNSTEGYGLLPRDLRSFDRARISDRQPRFYDTWGSNLVLDSTPDSGSVGDNIVVRYWQTRTRLSTNAATAIHERWDEIIMWGATWRAWDDLNNIDRADQARDNFARMINEIQDIQKIQGEDWGQSSEPQIQQVMRQ